MIISELMIRDDQLSLPGSNILINQHLEILKYSNFTNLAL